MANNIVTGFNGVVAKSTVTFATAGITALNTEIIYQANGASMQSFVPGRAINGISGFTAGKGYFMVAKTAFDIEAYVVPPVSSTPQLSAPGSFAAVPSGTTINLNWTSPANATGYVVDRATNSGFTTGVTLGVYTGSATNYSDTGLTASTAYYYRIRATAVGYTDSTYATANATTGVTLVEEPIVWSQLQNTTTNSEGDLIAANTNTPAGGTATKRLNKATGAYVQYVFTSEAEMAAACLILSTADDADYNFSQSAHFSYFYANAGNINWFNNGAAENEGSPAAGEIFRMEISGNDLLFKHSTNGGSTFTTLDTAAGALTGKTNLYIKGSLINGSTGIKLNNVSGYNLI
jgi:hypothetical protein